MLIDAPLLSHLQSAQCPGTSCDDSVDMRTEGGALTQGDSKMSERICVGDELIGVAESTRRQAAFTQGQHAGCSLCRDDYHTGALADCSDVVEVLCIWRSRVATSLPGPTTKTSANVRISNLAGRGILVIDSMYASKHTATAATPAEVSSSALSTWRATFRT